MKYSNSAEALAGIGLDAVSTPPPPDEGMRTTNLPLSCEALELQFEIARIDLVFRQNILGVAALILYSVTYTIVSWSQFTHGFLTLWLGILLASACVRLTGARLWSRAKTHLKSKLEARKWLLFIHLMLLISGLGWGAIGLRFGEAQFAYQQLITALHLKAVGFLMFIYAVLGLISSRNLSRYVIRSLRVNLENSRLAMDLRQQVETRMKAQANLEETQTSLKMALQSSNAFIWEWDPRTDTVTAEGKTVPAAQYLERFKTEDRTRFRERLWQMARLDQNLDDEFCSLRDDGQITYWAYRGHSHRQTDKGEFFTVAGIYWDATEKRMQATLRRERDIYEADNQAKSVFLANASHEIRTPLASINGFAELLSQNVQNVGRNNSSEQQHSFAVEMGRDLQVILRNGKYLASLVNDLLDLSKIESHRLDIQKTKVSISREIEDAILIVRAALESKSIRLHLNYNSKVPEFFDSDGVRIRQILINLLSNASKFTSSGSIKIDVDFRTINETNGILRIVVRDTGIGLSQKEQGKLFQPFVRGESIAAQKVQGSGLGLALSQELARLLGGDLRLVRSAEGQGSEFEFTLAVSLQATTPLIQISPNATTGVSPARSTPATSHVLDGVEVLVVDDAPDLRSLMRRYLEKNGARVSCCENGQRAIELASEKSFDMVLMDMKMPVMNGYEATRALRQQGYRRPIIAITAHASPHDRQACYEAGCDDYLSKPIDAALLVQTLSHRIHFEKDLMI